MFIFRTTATFWYSQLFEFVSSLLRLQIRFSLERCSQAVVDINLYINDINYINCVNYINYRGLCQIYVFSDGHSWTEGCKRLLAHHSLEPLFC